MQYKCSACEDTGNLSKHLAGNLDCASCSAATDRVELEKWLDKNTAISDQDSAWLIHQRALAIAPKQEAPQPVTYRSEQEVDNLIELAGALEVENVRQIILEMRLLRFREGPFQAGYETALDEIETRLGFELTEQAPLISDLGASNETKAGNTDNSSDMPPWPAAAPAVANGALTDEREIFDRMYLSMHGFHTKAELDKEWHRTGAMFCAALASGPDAALIKALEDMLEVWENSGKKPGWVTRWEAAKNAARAALSGAKGN